MVVKTKQGSKNSLKRYRRKCRDRAEKKQFVAQMSLTIRNHTNHLLNAEKENDSIIKGNASSVNMAKKHKLL